MAQLAAALGLADSDQKQHRERAEHAGYQIEVLKREVGRLAQENSQLRHDLLGEADAREAQEKAHYQAVKQLEAQLTAVQFAREHTLQRLARLEKENNGLKQKASTLLSIGQQCSTGGGPLEPLSQMTISRPLESKPSPAAQAKTSRGAISLIKAPDLRILSLEKELKEREKDLQDLQQRHDKAQEDLARRDAEIKRLSSQLCSGPDVDQLAWQYRNEANEAVILQLTQQVEVLTHELSDLQQRAVDRAVLDAAEQGKREAEARAQALERERESIAAEVEDMQKALERLQQEAGSENQARMKLSKMKATLEEVRSQKAQLEGQLTHAETKVADLRERLEQREAAVRKAQQRCKQLEAELKQQAVPTSKTTLANGAAAGSQVDEEVDSQCGALQAQLEEAERLRQETAAAKAAVEQERDQLHDQLQHLTDQLHDAQQKLAEAAAMAALSSSGSSVAGQAGPPPSLVGPQEARQSAAAVGEASHSLRLQQQIVELGHQVEQLEFERAELRVKLEESESQVAALIKSAQKLSDTASQHGLAPDKQAPQHCEGSGDGPDWRLAAERQTATAAKHSELEESRQSLQLAREQEELLRQQMLQLRERIVDLEARNAALQVDLATAQAHAGDAATAAAAVEDLRRQLEERGKDVSDLASLSLKADTTVQQYMVQLKHMATELRVAELRLEDAEAELRRRGDMEQRHEAELAELRGVVGALDAERDSLQAELDRKAETAAAQAEAAATEQRRLEDTERSLAATEGRLAASNSRIQECEKELQQLHSQVGTLTQHLGALEAEYEALRDEFRAVTDDLEAMVKENQVVSNQLCSVTQEREELGEQARLHSTRAAYYEQLVRARESDLQDVRTAYEGLANENQRLQSTVTQLQRELAARESELAIRTDEIASLREAQRSAQSQINQYISDLQAYERQFDSLSRAMHQSDNMAEGLDQERQALLDQLRAAEQVRFELERSREALQRQLAHAEGSIGVLQARLADQQGDAESLRQRVSLEQARVGELEGLLAMARAEQFNKDAVTAASGADRQIAALKEQKGLLEDQVATLQRQVDGLVQRRDSQEQQIAELKGGLAAQHDAGSAGQEVQKENAVLVQQLTELQSQCQAFASEAEELRGRLSSMEAARAGAEAGLASTQQELAQLRDALRQSSQQDGTVPAHFHSRLYELETLNASLQQQMEALQQAAGGGSQAVAALQAELEEVKQENNNLVDMLARMDGQLTGLQRERSRLEEEAAALRVGAPAAEGGPLGGAGVEGSTEASRLRRELQQERARRQQAEADFHNLVQSWESMQTPSEQSPAPSGASHAAAPGFSSTQPGTGGSSARRDPTAAVGHLQAVVWQLEKDNGEVQGSLQRTRHAMQAMQLELSKVAGLGSSRQ